MPISTLATASYANAPLVISHQNQLPAVTISFNLAPGYSLSQAVDAIHAVAGEMRFPASVRGELVGKAAEFSASLGDEVLLLLAAIVVIYIVLGVLYESYIHPITIISTLPPAGVGALLALMLFGMSLSVDGIVGIVLLIGIVKKNAIMMIDFAIEAKRGGMNAHDAIRRACLLRFRPIMMTTFAALFGALPLALGTGIGSELRRPLGVSIVGGLLLSQLVTLYTTPVIYLYMERFSDWVRNPACAAPTRRAATPAGAPGEYLRAIHPAADRHLAAGRRPARGRRDLLLAARHQRAAADRFLRFSSRQASPAPMRAPWPRRWHRRSNAISARCPASTRCARRVPRARPSSS